MLTTHLAPIHSPTKALPPNRFEAEIFDAERSLTNAEGLLSQAEASFSQIELTVVMPCLNEADTVATCVSKAVSTLASMGIASEVIVADNGSTDGSQELARSAGARVVQVAERGYGAALMGGIREARGKYVVMGDADDSYDFAALPFFYEKLRAGIDIVQGCRLPRGGGTVLPGAMPFLHRWFGNPA